MQGDPHEVPYGDECWRSGADSTQQPHLSGQVPAAGVQHPEHGHGPITAAGMQPQPGQQGTTYQGLEQHGQTGFGGDADDAEDDGGVSVDGDEEEEEGDEGDDRIIYANTGTGLNQPQYFPNGAHVPDDGQYQAEAFEHDAIQAARRREAELQAMEAATLDELLEQAKVLSLRDADASAQAQYEAELQQAVELSKYQAHMTEEEQEHEAKKNSFRSYLEDCRRRHEIEAIHGGGGNDGAGPSRRRNPPSAPYAGAQRLSNPPPIPHFTMAGSGAQAHPQQPGGVSPSGAPQDQTEYDWTQPPPRSSSPAASLNPGGQRRAWEEAQRQRLFNRHPGRPNNPVVQPGVHDPHETSPTATSFSVYGDQEEAEEEIVCERAV